MNFKKKVFWDPNAEENHTLQRLVKKERVEAGFFPPDGLYILVILQRLHSPLKLNGCLWKSRPYGPMQLTASNIKSNINMSGFSKKKCTVRKMPDSSRNCTILNMTIRFCLFFSPLSRARWKAESKHIQGVSVKEEKMVSKAKKCKVWQI